jgi:glycosyltransferase involved in cell wall biosynthesis
MRIAFVTNIVSPYRVPVLSDLARTPGWSFRVFVNAEREFDRPWEVDTQDLEVVRSRTFSVRRRVRSRIPVTFDQEIELHLPVGLWHDLAAFRPQVVITHELGPRSIVASSYARRHGLPLVVWSYQSRVSASQGAWRDWLRRQLLRQADAVVGMGTQARSVLRGWGVENDSIHDALNACDHETLLSRQRDPAYRGRVARWRHHLGGGRRLALVVGRLVPLKGTAALLDSWRLLPAELRERWQLVFAGDGPLSGLLSGVEGVSHLGHVSPETLAELYGASDLHVFPSLGDVWGLVANEAAVCGVPSLCSIHAGCVDDLITHGVDGLIYDPTSPTAPEALAAALRREDLPVLGRAAQQRVADFTSAGMASGFRRAVDAACQRRGVRVAA